MDKSRLRWSDLSEEEKDLFSKHISNGCGPKSYYIKSPQFIFGSSSCTRHDFAWWVGGGFSWFIKSNLGFYRSMVRDCKDARERRGISLLSYIGYRVVAFVYAVAVSSPIGYFFFYNRTKTPRTKEELIEALESF
jgi:hypothetical protein